MKKTAIMAAALLMLGACSQQQKKSGSVEFVNDEAGKKVDVLIDGKYFTSYIYPDDMEKQVLWPIMTASGKDITRGYPRAPRPFERVDHPHHVGLWFNFGNVNGLDFWNNSFAIKPEAKDRYGSVEFRKIVREDPAKGELVTLADWTDNKGNVLMEEEATYAFGGDSVLRTIARTTKLTAKQPVTFTENKEGLFALRMDRAFEEPADKPQKFLDSEGNVTEVPILNNDGVNGVYRNAEGVTGGDVWGKKSPWVALRAVKDGEPITVVILDNPANPGYPAWSHARGYGLFSANNLGGRAVNPETEELKITLKPGETLTFKHKVVIGGDLTDAQINQFAADFR